MSRVLPPLLVLVVTALVPACTCQPRRPVMETLKEEGEACQADDACKTGLCDGLPSVCVRKCSTGCLAEEVCTQLTPGRFSCQPDQRRLCQTCQIDADCPYPADKCIVVNGENVCGRDCAFDQSCPSGYVCVNGRGTDGQSKVQQCSPMVASCACLARGDLMQPCATANDAGVCIGLKTCDLVANAVTCNARTPAPEACNGQDDDCDGMVDEDASLVTCGVGACQRTVNTCTDGGTVACVPGQPTMELCNNVDDDCNGTVDNGFQVDDDVNNCGGCGVVCALPNATPVCTSRMCRVGMCNAGFGNCDGQDPNGCETNTQTSAMHCGQCGNSCMRPNSTATCVAGACQFQCAPNFYDLNGDPSDGCEYACTFTSMTDLPDLNFVDANCDGIDGEVMRGVFVSTAGNDANPGTRQQPKATLAAALTTAATTSKRDVYVAQGTYAGPLQLLGVSGLNVAGAYHPTTWQRATTNQVVVQGGAKALELDGSNQVLVQSMRFEGGPGAPSAYGGFIVESQNVRLEAVELRAGNGADGADGAPGQPGTPGQPGQSGGSGCSRDPNFTPQGFVCLLGLGFCSQPRAGNGGTSACGFPGGVGGTPTFGVASPGGSPGSAAPNGTGSGGLGVSGTIGAGPAPGPANGGPGAAGSTGSNGAGAGASAFNNLGFVPASGQSGTNGTAGRGGGGGGGGCGNQFMLSNITCQTFGSGGGGGGGGGCGGNGGGAGGGGGASVGLFLFNSTVSGQGVVIVAGNGGRGGNGGMGGTGGLGGSGGASPHGGSAQGNACVGGVGGAGGLGGAGGHGGAGSGGAVYGIVRNNGSTWSPTGGSINRGTPGAAGTSPGNGGQMGATGVQLTF
jgi:hypothetical protein